MAVCCFQHWLTATVGGGAAVGGALASRQTNDRARARPNVTRKSAFNKRKYLSKLFTLLASCVIIN